MVFRNVNLHFKCIPGLGVQNTRSQKSWGKVNLVSSYWIVQSLCFKVSCSYVVKMFVLSYFCQAYRSSTRHVRTLQETQQVLESQVGMALSAFRRYLELPVHLTWYQAPKKATLKTPNGVGQSTMLWWNGIHVKSIWKKKRDFPWKGLLY